MVFVGRDLLVKAIATSGSTTLRRQIRGIEERFGVIAMAPDSSRIRRNGIFRCAYETIDSI